MSNVVSMPTDAQGGSQNAPERQKLAPLVREFRTHNLIIAPGARMRPRQASTSAALWVSTTCKWMKCVLVVQNAHF